MKILNKAVLFIYSIFVIAVSFVIMFLPLNIKSIIGIQETVRMIRYMEGNYIYTLIGAILLVLSITYLFYLFRNKESISEGSFLVLRNDYGEILIYQDTIVGLVSNVAQKFTGIRNIKSKVTFVEGKINLSLKGESNNEINIPETSMDLQMKVKEHVENITGAQVSDIKIEIVNVAQTINRG
ncbi:MAG: alkaline shock response membrane anchor protein AmaP [Tissierellaceae bacterium]|nr:alkaline shock response membrane anchor protein AmaP [Tissierellaceae bacterium]